jgi:hypothetical protein
MDYARFNYICTTRRQGVHLFARWVLRSLCGEWGYRNSKLNSEAVPTLDKWILEKREIQCKQSSSFDPTSQTEDIGNNESK